MTKNNRLKSKPKAKPAPKFWFKVKTGTRLRASWLIKRLLLAGLVVVLILMAVILLYSSPRVHPVSTLMLARVIAGESVTRQWVSMDRINPVLVHSVMVSEDAKFCAHQGVDWPALNQVLDDAIDGARTRGASTLSMQVVKNLFLWHGRSFVRKGLELPLALVVDRIWSKKRLMEIYLNIVEWDEGIFGIEAASRHYFNRKAVNLSARQSALLAVSLPNPVARNPARPSRTLGRLAKRIEARAYQSGAYVKCLGY